MNLTESDPSGHGTPSGRPDVRKFDPMTQRLDRPIIINYVMHLVWALSSLWVIPWSQASVLPLNINWRTDLPHHRLEKRQKHKKQKTFYANIRRREIKEKNSLNLIFEEF